MNTAYYDPAVLDRVRLCLKKKRYGTKARGWEVCRKMFRRYGELMGPYHCGFEDHWHVGHPKSPRLQAELRMASLLW